jgi:tRNA1(Val) A37 N6-methylase TrmN6
VRVKDASEAFEQIGPYTLRQRPDVFPLGGDTLALGGFASLRRRARVCDLGCGSGALGLLLLVREPSIQVTGVELSETAAALARENVQANGLDAQVLRADLRQARSLFPPGSFELAVSNPPYFPVGSGASGGSARMEETCTLADLCAAAGWLVKNGGRFALVYRPERLADLFQALRENRLEPKRLQFLQPEQAPPSAVLVEAVKQARPGLQVLPALRL